MDGAVDQIKQKLDIVDVLGEYLKLSKAGRNFKARCPFHGEKDASFMVSPERQIWHCFGCGLGGDIFGFVMKMEGVEFVDALRLLARRAGVILKKQDPQIQSQKNRLHEICELAAKFFETQLVKTSAGEKALKYLKGRGLKDETIKTWRLGWAHNEWRALHDFLVSRGFKEAEMLQAGLVTTSNQDSGKKEIRCYDRFRSRIIFPIFDIQGQVIAFGGRIFGDKKNAEAAKYLNSPQTPLYDKSNVLYGLHQAKLEIRRQDLCVIVEGYMDLIMSHQAGVENVVASSGTALTENHLNIISRYTKNLAMAFDSDEAGGMATGRSIDLALKKDLNVKIILMKDKDPADVVKKDPNEWLEIIKDAKGIMDFYFQHAFAKFNSKNLEGKKEIEKVLLPVIKSISSRTEQSDWLKELAQRLHFDEKDLLADMRALKVSPADNLSERLPSYQAEKLSEPKSRAEGLEERFLGLCLANPQHLAELEIIEEDFCNEALGKIFSETKKFLNKKSGKDLTEHLRSSLAPELKMKIDYLFLQVEQHPKSEEDIIWEIKTCLKELKLLRLRQQLTELSFEIKDAQSAKDKSKIEKLLKKFNQLTAELTEAVKIDSAEKFK